MPLNVGDLGKLFIAKGFKRLPKIARSGHTDGVPNSKIYFRSSAPGRFILKLKEICSTFWRPSVRVISSEYFPILTSHPILVHSLEVWYAQRERERERESRKHLRQNCNACTLIPDDCPFGRSSYLRTYQCDQIWRKSTTLAIFDFFFLFGKMMSLLWQICDIIGLIFIVVNGQILKKIRKNSSN